MGVDRVAVGMSQRCRICGRSCGQSTCDSCAAVAALIPTLDVPLFCIVDGSYYPQYSGAGLVLVAEHLTGDFIAFCACHFDARSGSEAEVQAVIRGRRWAPGVPIYTDSTTAMKQHDSKSPRALFIAPECRDPNHSFAHRLSRQARLAHRAKERVA